MNVGPRDPHEPPPPKTEDPLPPVPKPAGDTAPPSPLTPEEQMALFEQELKETDWGHQPC
jgi:hypothetical protein